MNIGIDVRPTERPSSRRRGVGLYTREMCSSLLARNRALGEPHSFTMMSSQIPAIRKPSRLQWMVDRWMLPGTIEREKLQVFHATEFTSIPLLKKTTVIAHVHDMIPFLFWKEYSQRIPADYRWALQLARKRLSETPYVVTVSQHSKKDIVELTGYPAERIFVAYEGPPEPSPAASPRPLPEGEAPYFLYVGGTDFRKNVTFLVRAFARFAEKERDIKLLLVGETFAMQSLNEVAEILREVRRLGISDRVETRGYVDDRELRDLYRGSVALVFPSLYEGFGLPVLEAMSYGVPVLAARTSSIPEVLGDTGTYFDPRNEDSLMAAFETACRNPARLEELAKKARERSRLFTWDTVADVMFGIYKQIGV
jgi:glycosyltransferase involved in cell wall biosynthesis